MRLLFVVLLFLTTGFIARAGDSLFVYGTVTFNELNESLQGVSVYNSKHKLGVITNVNGEYRLYIPDSMIGKKIVLTFTYLGCYDVKRKIRIRKQSVKLNVTMKDISITID